MSGEALRQSKLDQVIYQSKLDQVIYYMNQGDYHKAREICQRLYYKNPHHPEVCHLLGVIACANQEHNKALTFLKRAIKLDQNNIAYHEYYAKALIQLGRHELAATVGREISILKSQTRA